MSTLFHICHPALSKEMYILQSNAIPRDARESADTTTFCFQRGEKIRKEGGKGVASEVEGISRIVSLLRNTMKKEFLEVQQYLYR